MKAVLPKDLQLGKKYSDIPFMNGQEIIMEFVKYNKEAIYLKHVSGNERYIETDGLIEFPYNGTAFYEIENQ